MMSSRVIEDADVVACVVVRDRGDEAADALEQFARLQCEVLSLIGDVAEDRDGPGLNVHVVLGLSGGTMRGGHLIEGGVFPALEVVVTEDPAELRKVMHPELGIALIDLDGSGGPPRLAVRGVWPVPPPGTLAEETGPTRGRSGHACDQGERVRRTRRPAGRGGGHAEAGTG
jgi:hypothetical protein